VAGPYEWLSLDAAVDRQQKPTMVITMAMAGARFAYKFAASSPSPFNSTKHNSLSLNCEAVAPVSTLN
jgi:hypothetical protein